MNFSSMEYFAVLARERSFTKAAQQLHITQQSLSSHIAALERELGCPLLVRRIPLRLTYAGSVFLHYAENIRRELDCMNREFCDITKYQKGVLRIGIAFTRGHAIMPELIARFQMRYPNIEIHLSEATNRALHQKLLDGDVDLAVANFPDTLQGVELRDFYGEEIVLLISNELFARTCPLPEEEAREHIAAGDLTVLAQCPFILGNSRDIAGELGLNLLRQSNLRPAVRARSDNMETLLSLCIRSVGACFCPENLVRATLTEEQAAVLKIFSLPDTAKYPIRFGYLKSACQWSILSEFMESAHSMIKEWK